MGACIAKPGTKDEYNLQPGDAPNSSPLGESVLVDSSVETVAISRESLLDLIDKQTPLSTDGTSIPASGAGVAHLTLAPFEGSESGAADPSRLSPASLSPANVSPMTLNPAFLGPFEAVRPTSPSPGSEPGAENRNQAIRISIGQANSPPPRPPASTESALNIAEQTAVPPAALAHKKSPSASSLLSMVTGSLFSGARNRKDASARGAEALCHVTGLPVELAVHLASLLHWRDALALRATCKFWHRALQDDSLWTGRVFAVLADKHAIQPHKQKGAVHTRTTSHSSPRSKPGPLAILGGHLPVGLTLPYAIAPDTVSMVSAGLADHQQRTADAQRHMTSVVEKINAFNIYCWLSSGMPRTAWLSRCNNQLQGTFHFVTPGAYEVVWHMRLRYSKVANSALTRFDTCVHYACTSRDRMVEYGTTTSVWNVQNWMSLEQQHGRGNWFAATIGTVETKSLCKVDVALKGFDACSGISLGAVQLLPIKTNGHHPNGSAH